MNESITGRNYSRMFVLLLYACARLFMDDETKYRLWGGLDGWIYGLNWLLDWLFALTCFLKGLQYDVYCTRTGTCSSAVQWSFLWFECVGILIYSCKVFLSIGLQCCKWETVDCLRRHQGLYLYLWIARFQFMSLCLLVDLTCSNTILLLCREKLPKKSSSDLNIYTQHQWSWQNIMRMISYDSREEHWLPHEETDGAMNAQYCMIPVTRIRKDSYTYTATYGHRQYQRNMIFNGCILHYTYAYNGDSNFAVPAGPNLHLRYV